MKIHDATVEEFETARRRGGVISRTVMGIRLQGFLYAGHFHFLLPKRSGCFKTPDNSYNPGKAPSPDMVQNPGDPYDILTWDKRDQLAVNMCLPAGAVQAVPCYQRMPDKYLAELPVEFDENGDPLESTSLFFDTAEEAEAAMAAAYQQHGQTWGKHQ